ncbi:MAG: gliding motility protein GldN [Flavobacteriales bacterium]
MKQVISIIALLLLLVPFKGNTQVQTVLDGAYVKEHNPTKRVIPYPHLREADVMYQKRIWEEIDLKQKMNHPLYFPERPIQDRKSLFEVVKDALLVDQSITAYGLGPADEDDEFLYPLSREDVEQILEPIVTNYTEDPDTGERIAVEAKQPVKSTDIARYQIKEDWIFDKQRSERYVRIIGICPMKEDFDDDGAVRGYKKLFWLYFPECRYVFANADAYNFANDSQRRTFEDIFQKRYFSSFIVKESNVYDRSIRSYAQGIDQHLEAERIKYDQFILEHDLWSY